ISAGQRVRPSVRKWFIPPLWCSPTDGDTRRQLLLFEQAEGSEQCVTRYPFVSHQYDTVLIDPSLAPDGNALRGWPDHLVSFPCNTSVPAKMPLPDTVPLTNISPDGRARMLAGISPFPIVGVGLIFH